MSRGISNKGKAEMDNDLVSTDKERIVEAAHKRERLGAFLAERGMDAVLISRHENIAWATAGLVDVRVGILRESGAATLLVTREGRAFYLTTNNEAARLAEEEFAGLGYEPVVLPWYANDQRAAIANIVGTRKIAGDMAQEESEPLSLQSLRFELTDDEVARYRWLGSHAAKAATTVLRRLQPGVTERQMQAMLAEHLLGHGIQPSVYLTAVDARAWGYRHAVPRAGVLERVGMLGFCARRWGLSVSMTRFVQFGAGTAEIEERFAVVGLINARLLSATRAGETSDALFAVAEQGYAELGFPGEARMHHQGGATGYLEREWVARPGGVERVASQQAFAWNPNLRGAKVEDTVLLRKDAIELLTATPDLPFVTTSWDGEEFCSASVLQV
jgi:Xaa-Pro dipeptidase